MSLLISIFSLCFVILVGASLSRKLSKPVVLSVERFRDLKLHSKTTVSHNVFIYRLKLPTETSVLGLPIGQHISIGAMIQQPDGTTKEIIRSYTPTTGNDLLGYVDLLIKTYPNGNITQHLAKLSIGQAVRVRGPKGAFRYRPNMARRIGMVAGGTGITPMFQVLNAIVKGRATGDKTVVDLIFANVTAEDILLKDELDRLSKDAGVNVYYVLNTPPSNWKGGIGFVTADMVKRWLPAPAPDVRVLLCGPPPMTAAVKKITEAIGFDRARAVSKADDQVFVF